MALEIKRITKLDGKTVVRVLSPGTIFNLLSNIKKTHRDYNLFQNTLKNKAPEHVRENARGTWLRRAQNVKLIED